MIKRKTNFFAIEVLRRHEQQLSHECMKHFQELGTIFQKAEDGWEEKIMEGASFIIDVGKGREALLTLIADLAQMKTGAEETPTKLRFQISSLFLRECWEYLVRDSRKNERLHLVTGTITEEGVRVLSRLETVKYGKQSAAYVSADGVDAHQKIISLAEEHGHLVLGMFHSHMSRGAGSTSPSSVDKAFLERMAQLENDCLGGIFTLDGHVRFYTLQKEFDIEVYGKRVKKVDEKPFQKIFHIMKEEHAHGTTRIQNETGAQGKVG